MLTEKNDIWEKCLWAQKNAGKRRGRFVKNMEESSFPPEDVLTNEGFLILSGNQGTVLLGNCRYDGDYYQRIDMEGDRRRGRLDLLREIDVEAELLSPMELARRLSGVGKFLRVQREEDRKEFDVALLGDFPSGLKDDYYSGGVAFENGRMLPITVEPPRRANRPRVRFRVVPGNPSEELSRQLAAV